MQPVVLIIVGLVASLRGAPSPLRFVFENRHETLDVSLLDASHGVAPEALAELSHFVRCVRTDREKPIHPRLAEIVARTAQAFGVRTDDVISGYRAAPYGAPHSRHFLGHAMDLKLPGVRAKKLAAWVWHNFRGVGVGWYPNQDFVHIDVRDTDVSWIDTAHHGESGAVRYFARPSDDSLPRTAPNLEYDHKPVLSAAVLSADASKRELGVRSGN
jgi:uncharacterized protein YcbK (DUF882 family)